ncbi:MAG: hypothetical protein AAFX40_19825 [Cyanobacteria bacterium J06639_1]
MRVFSLSDRSKTSWNVWAIASKLQHFSRSDAPSTGTEGALLH